jgi:hypothetical protein
MLIHRKYDIDFQNRRRPMDCRVKPGNDDMGSILAARFSLRPSFAKRQESHGTKALPPKK